MNPISIVMAYGEKGPRADALQVYLLDHPKEYDFDFDFGDVEVDLLFALTYRLPEGGGGFKYRAVELKLPKDLVQSLQPDKETGRCHLDDQRRNCPYPLQVAVLGSWGDVLRAIPEAVDWNKTEGMIRRGVASLRASGVDVSFGVSPEDFIFSSGLSASQNIRTREMKALQENMAQVVREARAYLEGDIHLPRAKCESPQMAMLMCLPGVGPERARAILEKGIKPHLYARQAGYDWIDLGGLEDQLMGVDGVGKVTAKKIMEAVR